MTYKELRSNPMFGYLILLTIAMTLGFQSWRTLFNNYAVDVVGINGFQAGVVQSVWEIPGFLALLVVYLFLVFKEHRLAAFSVILLGTGVFFTGLFPSFLGLVITTLLMSIGFHYYDTMNQSLTLQYFVKKQAPLMIGRVKSVGALTNILVGVMIWFTSQRFQLSLHFMAFGGLVILLGIVALFLNPVDKHLPRQNKSLVFRKEYWLFYVLNFLSGARRQIFVVFAVFLLVERHHFQVKEITILFIINNIVTYFMAPLMAKAINHFGERKVLSVEYLALFIIFTSYALFDDARIVVGLYILDHVFFSAAMAINTFFQKTGRSEDIAPSMAVGFTINHISAVIIPVIGGLLWMVDWRIPFVAGAGIALLSLAFAQKVRIPGSGNDQEVVRD